MKPKEYSMFAYAQIYIRVANDIDKKTKFESGMISPLATNYALAIELYYKSLYLIERGEEFKVKGRHSHDVYNLFCRLPKATQQELTDNFEAAKQGYDQSPSDKLEEITGIAAPKDLPSSLKSWASVFVKFRYLYELNTTVSIGYFGEIHESVYKAIIKRRSSWVSGSNSNA